MKSFKSYVSKGYSVQLVRDKGMDLLNLKDSKKSGWVEVRGKKNYETAYDKKDSMHQTIDGLGKAGNISDLMNGEVVNINPNHPHGKKAIELVRRLLK